MMGTEAQPCYIVDKITGEIVSRHRSIGEATRKLSKNKSINKQVKSRKLIRRCRYAIRTVDDYNPNESFEGIRESVPLMCIYADHVDIYEDLLFAVNSLAVSRSAINEALRNPTRRICGQFRVAYLPRMGACNELIKRGVAHIKRRES